MSKLNVLTNIQKIDFVLDILSKYPRSHEEIFGELCISETNDGDINEATMILTKLVDDGYASYYRQEFLTTFEGEFLKETGGYKGLEESRIHQEALLAEQRKLQINTYRVTVILAIGTGIAAIYYLKEIIWH